MMPEDIVNHINTRESETNEILPSADNVDLIGRLVCGFLNAKGGKVVCGVNQDESILGITDAENKKQQIIASLNEYLKPLSLYDVGVVQMGEKDMIVIEVPEGKDGPYGFKNVIYVRVKTRNEKAGADYIRDMIMKKSIEPERWERRLSLSLDESDLDESHIRNTALLIRAKKGFPFNDQENPYRVMEDLSLARYGNYTQGGDVLFSRNPEKRFPQVMVRVVHYTDTKVGNSYLENDVYTGPLMVVLNKTLDFIVRNIPTLSMFYQDRLTREDLSLIPVDALREGLVNAFAHRDYSSYSGGIRVSIYPNRLEIWNSGSFPNGITPDLLTQEHNSVLVNPDIAQVLYLSEYMDKVGRGSFKIIDACKYLEFPMPVWNSSEYYGVTLTIYWNTNTMEDTMEDSMEDTMDVANEIVKLCAVLIGPMGRKEIQEKLKLNNAEHVRLAYITPALDSGHIEMTVPDKPKSKNQKYRLTKKGIALLKQMEDHHI